MQTALSQPDSLNSCVSNSKVQFSRSMQLAGTQCSICSQKVTFESEGTWCGACKTVFHHNCISQRNNNCPTCKRRYDLPESHFVFSHFCPECLNRNDSPQLQCNLCHARTQ